MRMMEWSATSATKAYLDTIKLCNYDLRKRRRGSKHGKTREPGSSEFVSALAAGMRAKLIVEVTSAASPSTIALAAAARQTGGRLVCILPESESLAASEKVIGDSGLKDIVEFETGDAARLLPRHANVDFSLVSCSGLSGSESAASYARVLGSIDVNPRRSVVVAKSNLLGFGGDLRGVLDEKKVSVASLKQYPIGEGMEVITMSEKTDGDGDKGLGFEGSASFGIGDYLNAPLRRHGSKKRSSTYRKSNWVVEFDEESGEEHIYRRRSSSSVY